MLQGLVPVAVPADTTRALVLALTDADLGAALAAGADGGATAAPPCRIAAGTLATGYVQIGINIQDIHFQFYCTFYCNCSVI